MPAITVRGVPDRVHQILKRQAEANNRSLNGEVLQLLEKATLGASGEEPGRAALLDELRRERKRTPAWKISSEEMKRVMREGLS